MAPIFWRAPRLELRNYRSADAKIQAARFYDDGASRTLSSGASDLEAGRNHYVEVSCFDGSSPVVVVVVFGTLPPSAEEDHHEKEELAALVSAPSEEVVRRLRAIGEPARLFGESDVARCERLAAAERAGRDEDEFKLEGAYAIRNTFLAEGDENEDESESEDETPPSNLKLIRSWIRARLGDWRRDLNARSDSEKRAPRGRVETKTFSSAGTTSDRW
ncbi:hypothetical protein CTAYLR_005249 [Chrysophaeum taylorii]|uniref:Pre-mRNA processing factor 4 (PRP4)-like domain-containing protein n=1 Tax=Chrysophaeum taylorii TaxID=2483200 RepID=A0AAD7XKK0_9STRA|nr:hypothetical protein CTAYLR_005249 [Chrysophaeum taylorii]